ncbi:MAG: hypothetical protein ACLTKE_05020 [Coprococcus sp.]
MAKYKESLVKKNPDRTRRKSEAEKITGKIWNTKRKCPNCRTK